MNAARASWNASRRSAPRSRPTHRVILGALQAYWFVHLGVTIELNPWDAFCPGTGQHLYPFYRNGLEQGTLTKDQAKSCCSASGSSSTTSPRRQGRRDRRGKQYLYRLCADQPGRR